MSYSVGVENSIRGESDMDIIALGNVSEIICIGFGRGDLFLEGINEAIRVRNIINGAVVSGMGTFDKCRMHFTTNPGLPPHDEFVELEGALELVSVHGLIVNGKPHLHMTVGDMKRTWAGHLEEGCRVLYLAEVAIARFENMPLVRVQSEHGIRELHRAYRGVKEHHEDAKTRRTA